MQIKEYKLQKFRYKLQEFLGGWITAHCSYLDGGRSFVFGTILAFNTTQRNICSYIIVQHWKGRLEKTKLQKYSHRSRLCQR